MLTLAATALSEIASSLSAPVTTFVVPVSYCVCLLIGITLWRMGKIGATPVSGLFIVISLSYRIFDRKRLSYVLPLNIPCTVPVAFRSCPGVVITLASSQKIISLIRPVLLPAASSAVHLIVRFWHLILSPIRELLDAP